MKKTKGMKRALSLMMCAIMVFGMLPVNTFSVTTDEYGAAVYEIGDTVWVRGEDGEPAEASAPGTFWLPVYDDNDQPVTKQGLCEKTEHTHAFVCAEDCQLAHVHDDSCYTQEYIDCVIHTHTEDCITEAAYDCGKEVHENHDSCTSSDACIIEEHDHVAMSCPTEVQYTCSVEPHVHTECQMDESGQFTCGKKEHTHSVEAGCKYETVVTCGKENHAHAEGNCTLATVYDCGKELHTHEDCTTSARYVDCVEHTSHDENCATEQKLTCGREEHTCITEGCAQDCPIEQHVHTAECDMEATYYKWEVVEDTSSNYAEKGLPIHFFIAEPGQAVYPNGRYVNYKQDLWGKPNGTTGAYANKDYDSIINTENGIRNVSDENLITTNVFQWPAGYSAESFKDYGSIKIGSTTYKQADYEIKWVTICYRKQGTLNCNCGVSYEHIHIDGVLTKKIAPAELKLTKTIPEAQNIDETFTFALTRLNQDANNMAMNPEAAGGIDTSFGNGGSITLSATIPEGETSASIVSATGAEIGYGYYMLTENTNSRWQTSAIEIKRNNQNSLRYPAGPVFIQIATDGTLRYNGTYYGTYTTATSITIENERAPLEVTYSWDGIPAGLTPLPESATEIKPGATYRINTSYPLHTRVMGKAGVIDPETQQDSSGYYYEFAGWRYYDPEDGEPQNITYNAQGVMSPGSITVNSDTNIHGLWVRHDLPRANGYITITKTFENKPADASFSNFYFAVLHNNTETDITPANVGTWSADGTYWTYNFPISENGEYTVVEGKYDVAGYDVTYSSAVTPVSGISTGGTAYTSSEFVSDGHQYVECGQTFNVTLPFDTLAVAADAAGQADSAVVHAATVAFTNSYTKKSVVTENVYPDFRVRKMDGEFFNTLTDAEFTLTGRTEIAPDIVGDTHIYRKLQPGTYTLVETKAPDGYVKDNSVYTVIVEPDGQPVEELRITCGKTHSHTNACYAYVSVQNYTIRVTDENGVNVNDANSVAPGVFNSNPEILRLNIPNERITADLTIHKWFENTTAGNKFTPASGTIMVDIYGPVVYTGGVITDVGPVVRDDLIIDSTDNWSLIVEDLPYGHYFLEETMASIHGYNWTGATFNDAERVKVGDHYGTIVKVESTAALTLNIKNQYTEWEAADFFVQKTDANQNDLAGAKFQLFDGTANVTNQYRDVLYGNYDEANNAVITNTNGVVHFTGFKLENNQTSKSFTLKEFAAPNGYYRTTNEYTVTVTLTDGVYDITVDSGAWNHDDDLLTVINAPILGQITVTKELKGDAIPEDHYVTFAVSNDNGYYKTATVTKEDNWTHTFTDLPLGSYTVTENYASVDGYTYTTTYSVNSDAAKPGASAPVTLTDNSGGTLTAGAALPTSAKANVTFTNTYDRQEVLTVNPDRFNVYKRDENGNGLEGAVFALYADEACTTKLTGVPFVTEATSDSTGIARFTGLKLADQAYGSYKPGAGRETVFYLKEIQAPDGYVLDNTVWKIKLGETIQVETLNDKNIFETVVDWLTSLWKPKEEDTTSYEWVAVNSLAVVNERIKGTLNITKQFNAVVEEADRANARIEIHVHGPITRGDNNDITDIGPLVEVVELKNGATTASLENLEVGEYVLRETFASIHDYTWDGVTYTVNGDQQDTVAFENADFVVFEVEDDEYYPEVDIVLNNTYSKWEAADFTIHKYRTNSDKTTTGLSGAVFELYDNKNCTGKPIKTQTTGMAGYATFSGFTVEEGKSDVYYLKEVTAPDNYYSLDTVWKVTISHDTDSYEVTVSSATETGWNWVEERDALWVENEEILGSITISKEFVDKPDSVNEVKVNLIGNGENREITLAASENAESNWTATVSDLPMGKYYIVEQDANVPGYTLTTTYYEGNALEGAENNPATYAEVTLDEGANKTAPAVSVKIKNSYVRNEELIVTPASFTVKKVDAEDPTKTLDGAKFRLYKIEDGDPVTVAEKETVNGIATFDNLQMDNQDYKDYTGTGRSVTYYLAEIDAPAGYAKDDTVWKVELSETFVKFDILNEDENIFETIINWVVGLFNPSQSEESTEPTYTKVEGTQLTVSNRRIKGEIGFAKTFSFMNSQNEPLNIDEDLQAAISIEIHAHGPVKWANPEKTEVSDMGQTHTVTLPGSALTDQGVLIGNISDLELGDYLIHETKVSVHGFNWENADVTVNAQNAETVTRTVDGKQYTYYVASVEETSATEEAEEVTVAITNHYKEWDAADFYVYKTDDEGNALSGATFKLYSDSNCENEVNSTEFTTSAVTGDDGMAHFQNFKVEAGKSVTYYVQESNAPAHFYRNENVWAVTISHRSEDNKYELVIADLGDTDGVYETVDDATDTITVVNQPILGELTITKTFDDDILADEILEKLVITVNVTGPNGDSDTVELKKSSGWTAKLEDLPLGIYTVTENTDLAKVAGYDLVSTVYEMDGSTGVNSTTFTDEDHTAAITITNTYDKKEAVVNNPDAFTIIKTDDAGNRLPGAEFVLTNDHNPSEVRYFTTGADGTVVVDGLIGNGTISGQSSRTYTLEETKAPVGHELGETKIWKINVTEKDGEIKVTLNAEKDTFETIWDWIIDAITPNKEDGGKTLIVENPRKTAQITVKKTVTYAGLTDPENDEMVESLKDTKYTFKLRVDGEREETFTLSADESKTFEVPYGSSYEVEEVLSDKDTFTSELSNNYSGTVDEDALNGITVEAKNTYTFRSGDPLKIDMVKVASGVKRTPLSGAKFTLYDGNDVAKGYYESDKNGEFQISQIDAPGAYTLKETVAPDGYYKLKKPITIEASYEYKVVQDADDDPVIVRTLVAKVTGKGVYEIGENSYGVKNTRITSNPVTGDNSNILLWIGIAVTSLLCMAMMIVFFPIKKGKYQR